MKFLLKSLILALALGATSSAFANSNPVSSVLTDLSDFTVVSPEPQSFFFDFFWKPKKGKGKGKGKGKKCYFFYFCKKPGPKDDPKAVPELNAAAAPISAAIALSALALGAERRRRKLQVERTNA